MCDIQAARDLEAAEKAKKEARREAKRKAEEEAKKEADANSKTPGPTGSKTRESPKAGAKDNGGIGKGNKDSKASKDAGEAEIVTADTGVQWRQMLSVAVAALPDAIMPVCLCLQSSFGHH